MTLPFADCVVHVKQRFFCDWVLIAIYSNGPMSRRQSNRVQCREFGRSDHAGLTDGREHLNQVGFTASGGAEKSQSMTGPGGPFIDPCHGVAYAIRHQQI